MTNFKELGKKVESKILSSRWTPRVVGAVSALGAVGGGIIASAEGESAATTVTTIDSSEVVQQ